MAIPSNLDLSAFECAASAYQRLSVTKQTAKEIGSRIEEWGRTLENRKLRTETIGCAVALKDSQELQDCISGALGPALEVLEKMIVARKCLKRLSYTPWNDPQGFVREICEIEALVGFVKEKGPGVAILLQKAVRASSSCRHVDNFSSKKLNDCVLAIRNGDIANVDAREIMNVVLERAEDAFIQILTRECSAESAKDIAEFLRRNERSRKCIKLYWDIRVRVLNKPKTRDSSNVLHVDRLEWKRIEEMVDDWLVSLNKSVKEFLEKEKLLAEHIFEGFDRQLWLEGFGKVAGEVVVEKSLAFGETVASSKQEEPRKRFKLLDMFKAVEKLDEDLQRVFEGRDSYRGIKLLLTQLQRLFSSAFIRSLSAFKKQVEDDSSLPSNGGLLTMTTYVLDYTERLVGQYRATLKEVLEMEGQQTGTDSLCETVSGIIETLERSMERRSKTYKDSALEQLFQMNNYWYIFKRARDSELKILGESWLKERRRWVNQKVLAYQKQKWGPAMLHLSREGLAGSNPSRSMAKKLFKQRLTSFNSEFEMIFETQRHWVVSDEELRESTLVQITQLLIPTYRSFVETYGHLLENSSHASRYLKYNPEQLQRLLEELFSGNPKISLSSSLMPSDNPPARKSVSRGRKSVSELMMLL